MEWQENAIYYTDFEPKKIMMEKIKEKVEEKDPILSYCLYSISWQYEQMSDGSYKTEMTYKYYMSAEQRRKVEKMAEGMAEKLDGKTDFEKIKAVHDYIVLNCEYSLFHNGAYNCLFNGKACCNGYALAFKMIMDECGIACRYVESTDHAWNAVCLDGVFYNVDLTWADGQDNTISYEYFLKSNADFPDHPGADATAFLSYDLEAAEKGLPQKQPSLTPFILLLSKYWWAIIIFALLAVFVAAEVALAMKKEEKGDKRNNFTR